MCLHIFCWLNSPILTLIIKLKLTFESRTVPTLSFLWDSNTHNIPIVLLFLWHLKLFKVKNIKKTVFAFFCRLLCRVHRAAPTGTVCSASPRKAQQSAGRSRCWAQRLWCCVRRSSCSRCWSGSQRCACVPCLLNAGWPSRSSPCPARGTHREGVRCPSRCPARPDPWTPPPWTALWSLQVAWIHRWRPGQVQEPEPGLVRGLRVILRSLHPPGSGSERSRRSSRTASVQTYPPGWTIKPVQRVTNAQRDKLLPWNKHLLQNHEEVQAAAPQHLVPSSQSGRHNRRDTEKGVQKPTGVQI